MPRVTKQSRLTLAVKRGEMPARPRNNFSGGTERIPDAGMCDISWLPSLSSLQSSRPQLCLHMLTGYVTWCPSDIFPGRESEYEMIILFTSYLWHCLLAVHQATQIALQSGSTVHLSECVWTSNEDKHWPHMSLVCVVTQHRSKQGVSSVSLSWFDAVLIA